MSRLFRRWVRNLSPTLLLLGGVLTALLLVVSHTLIDVRIVVLRPNVGTVTSLVTGLWEATLGIATLGSFGLAVWNHISDSGHDSGPTQEISISENDEVIVNAGTGESTVTADITRSIESERESQQDADADDSGEEDDRHHSSGGEDSL
jgi:hypothetical protein